MKRLLQLGFVLGFAATAAAGYFLPWIGYERYPSATAAVMNGGRSEQFLVRLPNDRIYAVGSTSQSLAGSPLRLPVADPASLGGTAATAIEHYKLRDINGNVVGVASRHATLGAGGAASSWLLSFPSRGVIVFGSVDSAIDQVETALASSGWAPGKTFVNDLTVNRAEGMPSVFGSREFQRIEFRLDETWMITGIDEDGELRGTIQLDTIGRSVQ